MNKVKVIGLGPGHRDYILPKAKKIIEKADVILGAKRNLASIDLTEKESFDITNRFKEIVPFIKENYKEKDIAVIVSGDTGFYSLLRYLKRYFSTEELEVIPGISSMQYMFAKIRKSWDRAFIGSLHGREFDFVDKVKEYSEVGFLTDKKWTPQNIAKELLDNKIKNKVMYIGENLSYENERITKASIEETKDLQGFDICVVVIVDEDKMGM